MDARNREVRDWLAKVRTKEIALPRFQRFEEWSYSLIEGLLTNVVRELPIGSTLVLGVGNEIPFICRDIVGAPKLEGRPSELLLDGQQRLTALWRSLNDNYPDRTYFVQLPFAEKREVGWKGEGYTLVHKQGEFEIYEKGGDFSIEKLPFRKEIASKISSLENAKKWIIENPIPTTDEEEKEPTVISEARRVKNGKRYPLWADQPKECWRKKYIPVRLLNPDDESEYRKWAEFAADGDPKAQLEIEHAIAPSREKVTHFKLPYLYLEPVPTTPRNVAIDVFIKLNTSYVKLTPFDIVVAQFEEATGESLHDLVNSLKGNVPRITSYVEPSDLVLSVAALFQNFPPNQRSYLDSLKPEKIIDDWPKIAKGSRELVQFLKEEGVLDAARLPTESVMAPLVALWAEAPEDPDEKGNFRTLLRKYLWRAFFTPRYDRSVPTAVLQDYRKLRDVVSGKAKEAEIPCFNEHNYPLPSKEPLMEARWPKRKDRLARAILLLTLRGGAEDIADGTPLSINNIQQREYHHLYPVAWFKEKGVDEENAQRSLNSILVTWRTNRKISAKKPVKYLLERCEVSTLGEGEIRRRLETHFVGFDLLANGDYERFIEKRAESCEYALKELCKGKPWTP